MRVWTLTGAKNRKRGSEGGKREGRSWIGALLVGKWGAVGEKKERGGCQGPIIAGGAIWSDDAMRRSPRSEKCLGGGEGQKGKKKKNVRKKNTKKKKPVPANEKNAKLGKKGPQEGGKVAAGKKGTKVGGRETKDKTKRHRGGRG